MHRRLEGVTSHRDPLIPLPLHLDHDPLSCGQQARVHRCSALCRSTDRALKRLRRKVDLLQAPQAKDPFINSTIGLRTSLFNK